MNSLPKTVTRQRRGCDLNPGRSAPESSTLTTRLPSHVIISVQHYRQHQRAHQDHHHHHHHHWPGVYRCGVVTAAAAAAAAAAWDRLHG